MLEDPELHMVSYAIIVIILIGLVMIWRSKYPAVGILILTNIAVFFLQWIQYNVSGDLDPNNYLYELGFSADYMVSGTYPWAIVTSIFVHGGFMHILGNMLFLGLMGMPFEERIGRTKFVIIYFAAGILANIGDALFTIAQYGIESGEAEIIGIGASGAIFGMLGGFAILYPRDEIAMIIPPFFLPRVPVWVAAFCYGFYETFAVYLAPADSIGHVAHVIGFIVGVTLAPIVAKTEERRVAKIDYTLLRELLNFEVNAGLHSTVEKVIVADIDQVRQAWWEDLVAKVRCPRCQSLSGQGGIVPGGHGLICEKCGYNLDIRKRKK